MKAKKPESFGLWFRRQLAELGWSQDRAARELDVTVASIRNWARPPGSPSPSYEPSYHQLIKVLRVFGQFPPELEEAYRLGRLNRARRIRRIKKAGEGGRPQGNPGDLPGKAAAGNGSKLGASSRSGGGPQIGPGVDDGRMAGRHIQGGPQKSTRVAKPGKGRSSSPGH
jgi:transcriptional regulator with XRE-family HTH domain